jgi:hypothetical protein
MVVETSVCPSSSCTDVHAPDRVRWVAFLPERKRQFTQPPRYPIRFNVGKVLTIHARCALVRAALSIGWARISSRYILSYKA